MDYSLGRKQAQTLTELPYFLGATYCQYLKWYYAHYISMDQEAFKDCLAEEDYYALQWSFICGRVFEYAYKTISPQKVYRNWRNHLTVDFRRKNNKTRFWQSLSCQY
jgi:hypothetical protein